MSSGIAFCDQKLKMVRLAKEIGLVGSDHVDQMDNLFLLAVGTKQIVAVFAEGVQIRLRNRRLIRSSSIVFLSAFKLMPDCS